MPRDPAVTIATKTAVFQLRSVSAWKRAAILDAMKRTHLATAAVVEALVADFDGIRTITKKTERTDRMQRTAYQTLQSWSLSGAGAAAARVDAMGMVESYLQTLSDGRETASPPTVPLLSGREVRYEQALQELAKTHATVDQESALRDELNRLAKTPTPRPLSLHGYGHFFRLLRHPETGRLYAWVNLLTSNSRFAPTQAEANQRAKTLDGDMVDLGTGEVIRCKRPTWVLFPLEFGLDFHEREFLLAGEPGGGRLVHRPDADRFELHVSFQYRNPTVDTAGRFLGVDRGIYNLAAWAVTDAHGGLIADGAISGMELRHVQRVLERRTQELQKRHGYVSGLRRRAHADEAVHVAANQLVALAKQHRARVVLEELSMQRRLKAVPKGNRGGRFGRAARRILGRQQYAKLVYVLEYKLARAGLPPPLQIGAAFTSQTCPECGHCAKENRPKIKPPGTEVIDMSRFQCVQCGHATDADRNAARVIATKGAWLVQLPTKAVRQGRPLGEAEKFPQYLVDAIRHRGPSVGSPTVPS